ncbi:MAG: amidohydrolase family protein [Bacteroidota bacterium]
MKKLAIIACTALLLLCNAAQAQQPKIDVHVHAMLPTDNGPPPLFACVPVISYLPAPNTASEWPQQFMHALKNPACDDPIPIPETPEALMRATIVELEANNAVGILSGPPDRVNLWKEAAPDRFIKSLQLNILRDPYSAEDARAYFADGGFLVLGEVTNQYIGIGPNDPRMMPYWAMTEEMDIPVQIHMGSGPPGAGALVPDFLVAAGNPLLLEPVLAEHPNLRISIMHMAEGFNDELVMMLWTYPQLYVDIGGIMWGKGIEYFYGQLEDLVNAGFSNRLMFGADAMTWPGLITRSLEIMENADFLSEAQKQDIYFNNAVRFFGLDSEEMKRRALGKKP